MRRKITIVSLTCACALLLGSAWSARAGSVPVASFPFNSAADLDAFTQLDGGKCTKKYLPTKAMGITVGAGSPECAFRTSVLAGSGDTDPSQDIEAAVSTGQRSGASQRQTYLAVFVRGDGAADYELRLIPATQRWTVIRRGSGGAVLARGTAKLTGKGKSKKTGKAKTPGNATILRLQVAGSPPGLTASINGQTVFTGPDPNPTPPTGRFNGVGVGNIRGLAKGARGSFTHVIVRI